MPWHDDIIQPKGQGMKKRVTDGKSAHCAQLCWSPWRGSGDLRGWIPPEGPWNSTWLSLRGHMGPSQCPMCPPSWSLPCHAATELLGFHLAAPSPPSCPPQQPPHTQPNGWKQEAFAQEWPGCFLPGLAVLWQQAIGLGSTSRHLPATLPENKNVFHIMPMWPCPTMPCAQHPLFKANFIFDHINYRARTSSHGSHLDLNRDKFRTIANFQAK